MVNKGYFLCVLLLLFLVGNARPQRGADQCVKACEGIQTGLTYTNPAWGLTFTYVPDPTFYDPGAPALKGQQDGTCLEDGTQGSCKPCKFKGQLQITNTTNNEYTTTLWWAAHHPPQAGDWILDDQLKIPVSDEPLAIPINVEIPCNGQNNDRYLTLTDGGQVVFSKPFTCQACQ